MPANQMLLLVPIPILLAKLGFNFQTTFLKNYKSYTILMFIIYTLCTKPPDSSDGCRINNSGVLAILKKIPKLAMSTATSRSASSQMIKGDLPPSSRVTGFKLLLAAASIMSLPTSVDPVKATYKDRKGRVSKQISYLTIWYCLFVTLSMSIWPEIAAPAVSPKPGRTFKTPSGTPAYKQYIRYSYKGYTNHKMAQ